METSRRGGAYNRLMPRHARQRLRIALAVILSLLFQQVAMAAYACTSPDMSPEPVAMAADCAEMGMEVVLEIPALCIEHCAPDFAVTPDFGTQHVPPLPLPPQHFPEVALGPVANVALHDDVPLDRSDPPPRLRYCSLLI